MEPEVSPAIAAPTAMHSATAASILLMARCLESHLLSQRSVSVTADVVANENRIAFEPDAALKDQFFQMPERARHPQAFAHLARRLGPLGAALRVSTKSRSSPSSATSSSNRRKA